MSAIQPALDRLEFPVYARFFAAMHDAMRRDALRLVDAVDTTNDLAALARWFDRFESVIEHHHHCEDEIVWPGLEAIVARGQCGVEGTAFLDARLTLLDDHEQLDVAMSAVRGALSGASSTGTRLDCARRFQEGLDEHLTREEAALFPLLCRHVGEDEFLELEDAVGRSTPFKALTFTVPWVIDGAPTDIAQDIASQLPLPIRIVNRWVLQPRYRRLVEAATGQPTGEQTGEQGS